MTFSDLRANSGNTQEQFAKKLGISRSTVSMWELGLSVPKSTSLSKISEILGKPIECILESLKKEKEIRYGNKKLFKDII